jgi:hypothetical protein
VAQAKQFLDALFAGKEPGEFILIWLLDGRRSAWFTDAAQAAAFVDANRSRDVYVGVALSPADHGPHLRLKIEGGERMPTSISGLWSDIDIADAVHKKKNLAPTVEDARTVLFPEFPPSILLHSGGGLQAWWLFKEPWSLQTEEEARKAGALATRWIRGIRARAAARGWDIDSVGDLTRVLRVPGTCNCKIPGQPRSVQLIEINDRRYNPSEMDEYLDMIGAERVSPKVVHVMPGEKLEYSSDAEPPFQRFQVLCDVEPKFKAAWDHFRKDMTDQTASAYDMALANLAVQAGWTDQEVANLLIAHRRRYKEDLKLRDSYYAKTIAKARATFSGGDLIREIEDLTTPEPRPSRDADGERKTDEPVKEDPLQKKAALVDRISQAFGLVGEHKIIRITKFISEPREYAIETASGCIRLGPVQNLIEPYALQAKIAELAGRMIPSFKKNSEWAKIQQALLDACIDVAVGDEGTNAGLANSWLTAYLGARPVLDSVEESDDTRSPFVRDGRIHVYMADFRRWVHINHGDRIPPKEMGILMRRAGAEPVKVPCGRSSRQVWRLAEGFVPPERSTAPDWVTEEQPGEDKIN